MGFEEATMLRAGIIYLVIVHVWSLENGLIRTPPMGWLSWQRYRCNTDCVNDPDNCISEKLLMKAADLMVSEGYREAGYQYVTVDDCWPSHERAANGRLQPDPDRFPSGMRALADYIHSKSLKFGIYEDVGTKTCAGYPGSLYNMQLDAQTFADWQVDYLKFDGCNLDPVTYGDGYPPMAFFLNMTGRPIALSCEYALYERGSGIKPNYGAQAQACNVARNFDDIDDSWDSLKSVINFFGNNEGNFSSVAGPGFFNDPDMLLIGNFGLSYDQERVQMAVWSIIAAPLIMSLDLSKVRKESKALLQNKGAISVNQDPLGIQGQRVLKHGNIEFWTKPITPAGSYAFAILNLGTATPTKVSIKLSDIGLDNVTGYNLAEVFDGTPIGVFKPSDILAVSVNPSGVFFAKATVMQSNTLRRRKDDGDERKVSRLARLIRDRL